MAGMEVPPELLERAQRTLDGGSRDLGAVAEVPAPGINAGESTAPVAETLGLLMRASAGALAGVQEMASDVQAARDKYLNDDDAAAGLFTHEQ